MNRPVQPQNTIKTSFLPGRLSEHTRPVQARLQAAKPVVTAIASVCLAFCAINSTRADTQVRFEFDNGDSYVSEGYTGDPAQLETDVQLLLSGQLTENVSRNGDESASSANNFFTTNFSFNNRFSDVYIFSVGSTVYSDADRDGFFTRFSLRFDADVSYGEEFIFARILLRTNDSDYELFHTSRVFQIYEGLSSDEYELDTRLISNYPAGFYDVRIEVREAGSSQLLDVVDASTHRTLSRLPLESSDLNGIVGTQSLDETPLDVLDTDFLGDGREQIVRERVGASSALLPLLGIVLLAKFQHGIRRSSRRPRKTN